MSIDFIIQTFSKMVVEKFNVDAIAINDLAKQFIISTQTKINNSSGLCNHQFKTGKNKGTVCGEAEAESGSGKCKKHTTKTPVKSVATKGKKKSVVSKGDNDTEDDRTEGEKTDGADSEEETTFVKPLPKKLVKKTTEPTLKAPKKKMADMTGLESTQIQTMVEKRKTETIICENKFGNYEHKGTGLVWDVNTKMVTGRQQLNGDISPLSDSDIQLCLANGWKYVENSKPVISKPLIEVDIDPPSDEGSDVDNLYD
jgi:hypothetical protein